MKCYNLEAKQNHHEKPALIFGPDPYLALCFFGQAIINVNNTSSGVTAQYTTLAAAVAGAAEGTSSTSTRRALLDGSATINKKLTIIGPGYYVQQNPSLQINTYVSNGVVDGLTLLREAMAHW